MSRLGRSLAAAAAPILLLVACGLRPSSADVIAVPTQEPAGFTLGGGCPDALLEGLLVADDQFGFIVEHADGFSSAVTWPHGYFARDRERRELLDASGRVIAREGDRVALGGGETGQGPGFVVCGDFEVTPAS